MRLITCLMAFYAAVATAQTPPAPIPLSIVGPATAAPYRIVDLSASGELTGRALIWDIAPEDSSDVREMAGGKLIFVGPPGVYRIKLRSILFRDGTVSVETARHTLTIAAPTPPVVTPPAVVPPATKVPAQPGQPAQPGTAKIDALKALSQIRFPTSKPNQSAMCTATVAYPQLPDGRWEVLTAAHCVPAVGTRGVLTTRDKSRTLSVTVATLDRRCDLAWLVTDEPVSDIYCAYIARENPPTGAPVWHSGYGIDRPENREDGRVKRGEDSTGKLTFTLSVSQGDSGGGVIRSDTGEVVSAVCCTPTVNPYGEMFGGSCRNAWRLRPSAAGGVATVTNPDRGSEFIPARPYPAPAVGEGRFPNDLQHLPLVTGGQ